MIVTYLTNEDKQELIKKIEENQQSGGSGSDTNSIVDAEIVDENLIVTWSDGSRGNLGKVVGADGVDGFSPIANVTQTASGATISIQDKNGTTTATVKNGKDGEDGKDGYTPQKGVDYFDGEDGKDGSDASVTTENIKMALGYTPAVQEDVDKLSETIADYSVVDYVKTEAKAVVDKVVAKRTINSLVLLMGADIHVSTNAEVITAIKHMGQGMNEICKYITPDGAVFLGDYNYQVGTVSKAQGIEDTKYFRWCVADVVKSILSIFMVGNHDYISVSSGDTDNRLSEDEVYTLIGSHNTDKAVVDVDNLGRNYGYVDFEKQRIRLIYLNTTDITGVDYTSHLISTVQGQWFVNTALDLSDKEDEEKWGVIVCSHVPLFDNPQVPTVLDKFVDRASGGNNFGMSYDFSNVKANLIGVFHGHIHNFKVTKKTTSGGNKITYICIPNAVPNRENPYTDNVDYNEVDENGNSVSYPKTENTANDTSFNVVVIDRDNTKIHAICYGAGYDREINYLTGETGGSDGSETNYINQIPISTDSTGAIYNGTGYKDGVRTGSDGADRTGATTDATGFIPCALGDKLYFANCQIVNGTTASYQECSVYNSSKAYIGKVNLNTMTTGVTVDDNGYITMLDTSSFNSTIYANMAFVRITGNYIGSDSIITVNQLIS